MTRPALVPHLRRARDLADTRYAEPLDLDVLAAAANVSKYHFARSFADTYGDTPMRYLTRRRIERAQDLLRTANLTVTEVCMMVGFSSLGSFSSRFRDAGRRDPDAVPRPLGGHGRPAHPRVLPVHAGRRRLAGCGPRRHAPAGRATSEKRGPEPVRTVSGMITNVSLVTVWVADQDAAKAFYIDKLGFQERADITMGDGYRWCSVVHPDHPELQLTLALPGPPLDDESAAAVRKMMDKGALHAVGLATDDCRKAFEELSARGVEFLQEPSDRPYGVEAMFRDNSGNFLVMVEEKPYTAGDFGPGA